MRNARRWLSCVMGVTALSIWSGSALGQYDTDYEDVVADADGEVLTGQDGYYLPAAGSVDFLAYTYDGNTLGMPQNPQGGDQFVAGTGPAGSEFARAQRDVTWGTGVWLFTYDVCTTFTGTLPTAQNLGSASLFPYPGAASYIHLFSWVDTTTADAWNAFYLAYDAAGTAHAQPGMSPGPEWEALDINHWYRFATWIDFDLNQIVQVQVWDLTDCTTAQFNPPDWYLEGGSAGGFPLPTAFRLFAGSSTVLGNTVAADNVAIVPLETFEPGSEPFEGLVCGPRCPGVTRVSFSGMTPNSSVAIVASANAGTFVNPINPCRGITLDMSPPFLKGFPLILNSDALGRVSVQGKVPNGGCGLIQIQAVDLATCRVTGLRTIW